MTSPSKSVTCFCLALAMIFAVNSPLWAQESTTKNPNPFGDFDEDNTNFFVESDVASYCLIQAIYYIPSYDVLLAATAQYYGLHGVDTFASIETYQQFQSYLLVAAKVLYDGKTDPGNALIDQVAFAKALANVDTTPGWMANFGTSQPFAWYALWFLLYAAGDLQNFLDEITVLSE